MSNASFDYRTNQSDDPHALYSFILAGGYGNRLGPLSERRAKPALHFGGSYRIIDFTLSNCARSGVTQAGVLTQYIPHSLHEHIGGGSPWGFRAPGANLTILQPYLSRESGDWYQGNADAVYQNLERVRESGAQAVLVLAGDHIYAMDYRDMLTTHLEADADVTVGIAHVTMHEASRYGLVEVDGTGRIRSFIEKPEHPETDLASMGIYLFNADYLARVLEADAADADSLHDFGGDVLPRALANGDRVYSHRFDGYWRDVGTIESYWAAHMDLLNDPALVLGAPGAEVISRPQTAPPAVFAGTADVRQAVVAPGSTVHGTVERSVLFPGVVVEEGAVVRDSVLLPGVHIGAGAIVHRAVLDEQAVVGVGAHVGDPWASDEPGGGPPDDITVVGEGSWILAGTKLWPGAVVAAFEGRDENGRPSMEPDGSRLEPTEAAIPQRIEIGSGSTHNGRPLTLSTS